MRHLNTRGGALPLTAPSVHWVCAGLADDDESPDGNWYCPDCVDELRKGESMSTSSRGFGVPTDDSRPSERNDSIAKVDPLYTMGLSRQVSPPYPARVTLTRTLGVPSLERRQEM